jgi:hypothetical protein
LQKAETAVICVYFLKSTSCDFLLVVEKWWTVPKAGAWKRGSTRSCNHLLHEGLESGCSLVSLDREDLREAQNTQKRVWKGKEDGDPEDSMGRGLGMARKDSTCEITTH